MRIPKSWNQPHQVTFQKSFRFYARDTNGKYQIDVDELRSAFSLSGSVAERVRSFRAERIAKIAGGETPVTLLDGGIMMLHVAPFSAFTIGTAFSLQEAARNPNTFPTLQNSGAQQHQVTFDGLLITSNVNLPPPPQRAYTQVLRTGIVEAVASSVARGRDGKILVLSELELPVIRYARLYASALHSMGVVPPMAVFVSLLKVQGMRLLQYINENAIPEDFPCTFLAENQFHFVETVFDTVPKSDAEAAARLKATLDHLANAAGLPSSPNFDAAGKYTLQL
jgi:hypothetical protein